MDHNFFDAHNELYHRAKFGEDRTTRAGCRCENVFVFFGQAPSPEHCAFDGDIVRTTFALPFVGRFQRGLQLFSQGTALSDVLHSSHFCR